MSPYEFLCAASEEVFMSKLPRLEMRVIYRLEDGSEKEEVDVSWDRVQELQEDPNILYVEVK